MSVQTYVGSFAKRAGTGTQAITGVGFTPKAIIFWSSGAAAADGGFENADVWQFFGFSDGTHHVAVSHASGDALNPAQTAKGYRNTAAILTVEIGGALNAGVVSSLDVDGFTFNWTTVAGLTGIQINFLAIGGAGVSALVGDVVTPGSTGDQAVSGVGFTPDALLFLGFPATSTIPDASVGFGPNGMGWATSHAAQGAVDCDAIAPQNPSVTTRSQRTNACIAAKGAAGVDFEASLVGMTSDGFTLNWSVARAGRLGYLALAGVEVRAGSVVQPTSTGTQAISTPGLTPSAVVLMSTGLGVGNFSREDESRLSFGAGDGSRQRGSWWGDADAVSPTRTARYESTTSLALAATPAAAGASSTRQAEAALDSLDDQGFTLDWTTADATARSLLYLAIGSPSAAAFTDGDPGPIVMAALTDRTDTVRAFSNGDLNDAVDYESGYKAPRVVSFRRIRTALSDAFGQIEHASFGVVLSDTVRDLREMMADATNKYLNNAPLVVKTIADEARRLIGVWHHEMAGFVEDFAPTPDLRFEFTGADWLKTKLARKASAPEFWMPLLRRTDFPLLPSALVNKAAPFWFGKVSDAPEDESGPAIPSDLYPRGTADPGWLGWGYDYQVGGSLNIATYYIYGTTITNGVESQVIAFELGITMDAGHLSFYLYVKTAVRPDFYRFYLFDNGGFTPWSNPLAGTFCRYLDVDPDDLVDNPYGPPNDLKYVLIDSETIGEDYFALVTSAGGLVTPGGSLATAKGAAPTLYVGEVVTVAGLQSAFLVSRWAVKIITGVFVAGVPYTPGSSTEIDCPFLGDYDSVYGANYLDINGRRYTIVLARGQTALDAISGAAPIFVNVHGVEDVGDTTGNLITSPLAISAHFERNCLAPDALPNTLWLTATPTLPTGAPMVDEDAYLVADAAIGERVAGGYECAGGIGIGGEYESALDVLASLSVSGDFDRGTNRLGQASVSVEPMAAPAEADVIRLNDILHISDRSFSGGRRRLQTWWNVIPFVHTKDYSGRTGQGWYGSGTSTDAASITNYLQERTLQSRREYRWIRQNTAQGQATLLDVVKRQRIRHRHPLRPVVLTVPYLVGAPARNGSVLRLDHAEGFSASGWIGHDVRVTAIETDLDGLVRSFEGYDLQPIYDGLDDAVEPTLEDIAEQADVLANLRANVNEALEGNSIELTGDVTAGPGTGALVATIPNDTVTNAKAANMAEARIKLRADGAGTGDPIDGDADDASEILDLAADPFLRTSAAGAIGGTTSAGAVGSEPGSPSAGDLYFETNGFAVERYTGSIWARWGPIFPLTAPVNGDFSWVNQGGASVDTTYGGIYLLGPAAASTNIRARVKTAPSTPYTITAAILAGVSTQNFQDIGLCFRESSTGKMVTFRIDSAGIYVTTASGPTAFVTNLFGSIGLFNTQPLFWRVTDDGANLKFAFSNDGQHFIQYFSVSRTGYMAGGPDQVGFFVNEQTNAYNVGLHLLSWKEGS